MSELRLIRRYAEFRAKAERDLIPPKLRGIYALLKYRPRLDKYDVVYVGMAAGTKAGIRGRLRSHARKRGKLWTHFTVFAVWPNIRQEEVQELEGLFRHIYRKDSRANKLNIHKAFKKLKRLKVSNLSDLDT